MIRAELLQKQHTQVQQESHHHVKALLNPY